MSVRSMLHWLYSMASRSGAMAKYLVLCVKFGERASLAPACLHHMREQWSALNPVC